MATVTVRTLPWYTWPRVAAAMRQARRYPLVPVAILTFLLIIPAVFAWQVAPYDPLKGSLAKRLTPPVWQEGGSMDQRNSQTHTLTHPAAKAQKRIAAAIPERDDLQYRRHSRITLLRIRQSVEPGEEIHILLDRQFQIECAELWHVADAVRERG